MRKKAPFAIGITCVFVALAFQASAFSPSVLPLKEQETAILDRFVSKVEQLANESTCMKEFFNKLQDLCTSPDYSKSPVVHEMLSKLLCYLIRLCGDPLKDTRIGGLLNRIEDQISASPYINYLVFSYGVYTRHNPFKENIVTRFKPGLSMWRYSATSILIKGYTLVLQFRPFGIHQKMTGPQLGLMQGFKGIYIDHESKLTGDSYVFFMGHAHRVRVFDLNPLS